MGKFEKNLEFGGNSAAGSVFIVKEGANLLGWQEQGELGIILDLNPPDMV